MNKIICRIIGIVEILMILTFSMGCGTEKAFSEAFSEDKNEASVEEASEVINESSSEESSEESVIEESSSEPEDSAEVTESEDLEDSKEGLVDTEESTEVSAETEEASSDSEVNEEPEIKSNGYLVVIDPGHQRYANTEQEPDGPGSPNYKARVTGGTHGETSGLAEYELNLIVAEKLKKELISRGYDVIMTRESHDVDLSNSERAAIANEAGADVFVRIHANGSENTSVNGSLTLCPSPYNPYIPELYQDCHDLAQDILEEMTAKTGFRSEGVREVDNMSGINWCQVPVTIVEMGYMTNPDEDLKMASRKYQKRIVRGIANGIDRYFEEKEAKEKQ